MNKPTAPYMNITPAQAEVLVTVHGFGPPRKCWVPFGTTTTELTNHYFSRWWNSGSQLLLNGTPLEADHVFTQDSEVTIKRKPWFSWRSVASTVQYHKDTLISGAKLAASVALGQWLVASGAKKDSGEQKFGVFLGALMWMADRYIIAMKDSKKMICCCQQKAEGTVAAPPPACPPPTWVPKPELQTQDGYPTATPQTPQYTVHN
eukprot:TRINITY_DN85097_c0_g1_i1.p1 TRINITY_DN85097_c0_g1~~TRINITY_DN85097_c0_g1_i1.p1  ORF type:complete len:205 (-),score=31.12 TRINITY_DN85097_c0_g1_i1:150-764(-)